jgi:hypothetical protein
MRMWKGKARIRSWFFECEGWKHIGAATCLLWQLLEEEQYFISDLLRALIIKFGLQKYGKLMNHKVMGGQQ